jgi:uncharacterized protein YegP (UPF0339 family)
MSRRRPFPRQPSSRVVQFEIFPAFGKWAWWIRGGDGTIIAKCLRALPDKADCLADIESIRGAGDAAPIVFLNQGTTP